MFLVQVDTEKCDGCGQCAEACPGQGITVVAGKAQFTGPPEDCLGCESCVVICTNAAITVQEY